MTQILFVEVIILIMILRKNHLMKEGMVVEQSTTPMNVSMESLAEETKNYQPEVPLSAVFLLAQIDPSSFWKKEQDRSRTSLWKKGEGMQEN
jgi:hypothetical protein